MAEEEPEVLPAPAVALLGACVFLGNWRARVWGFGFRGSGFRV